MKRNTYSALFAFALLNATAAFAQTGTKFNDGYITVYKATAASALTNTGTAIVAEEYNTSTAAQTAPTFSVAVPTTGGNKLVVSGTATASGGISRSENGRYLLMPGYNGSLGDANSTFTTNAAIRTVNASGTVGAGIAGGGTLWLSASNNLRGGTSDDGTNYWWTGNGVGIQTSTNGTTITTVSTTSTNNRSSMIYNGQLYLTSGAGSQGIYSVGTGKPTTSGTTSLRLFTPTNTDVYGFSISPDATTIYYVAASAGGIYRSTFNGTTWTAGTLIFSGSGYTGLAVDWSNYTFSTAAANGARIFACNPTTIVAANDNGTATTTVTILRTEPTPANNAFRQLTFSPSKQTISLGANSPAAANINTSTTDAVLFQFNLNADEGNSTVKKVILNQSGSATIGAGNDISNFKLIEDANNNGIAEATETTLATGTVSGSTITFSSIALSAYINEGASKNFIVTGDVAATATNGHTFVPAIVSNKTLNSVNYTTNVTNAGSSWITIGTTPPTGNALTIATPVLGTMRITEFMYNGNGTGSAGEYVEFTNVGTTTVDMNGWSFDDNSETAGSQSLSGFGIVQPGESVIFTDVAASTFRSNWSLCAGIKVIGNNTNNLGREDEINLYNASGILMDRLTYGDQTYAPGSIRTTSKSGWVNAAGLGNNTITSWTLSAVADAEASYTSSLGEIGSPGKSTRAIVVYNPCSVIPNGTPTIAMSITTTNFLDGGVTVAPNSPSSISGVINDPTDPAKNYGVDFTIGDAETAADSLTVTVTSSNHTVVPVAGIVLSGTSATRNIKITPAAVGYSTITVTVSDGTNTATYELDYAASVASATPAATFWHTGMSDASDAFAIDDNYYISGDDELDILNVYSRNASGMPVASYDYTNDLSLPDLTKPEVDLEAATGSRVNPNKVYWLGSMSNGKAPAFDDKPNRNRIFATTFTGTGAATVTTFAGYYGNLRARLIAWGDANGYNFTASAAVGVDSKSVSGFAAEGMVFGPDNTTLYIGLRAPLVPTATRTKAVIAPILNFETWFNNGAPAGNPTFGAPIELNLGGRGFRDLIKLSNGTYVIIAGNPSGSPLTSAIYKWTGNAADAPIMLTTSADAVLNLEGVMQVNVAGSLSLTQLQVITDGGDQELYGDGNAAKDFADLHLRKFRSDNLTSINLCMNTAGDTTAVACGNFSWHGTTYTATSTPTYTTTNAGGCDSVITLHLTVNPAPANTITAGAATTFCAGGSVTFSAAAGNSYQWQLNGSNITGATFNTYAANATGNYSVIITTTSGCTATSSAQAVTVNTLPANTVTAGGATTFCAGNAVTFSTAAGNNYQWQLNGTAITGATTNTYSANATGNYSVVITDANSCTNTSSAQAVTVNVLPANAVTASGATTFCNGSSVTFSTAAGNNYQWQLNGTAITGATSNMYSANATGNYSVVITDANSCSNTSSAQAVTVNGLPANAVTASGATTFCAGNAVTFSTAAGNNYQWQLNGSAITGATTNTYAANATGNYSVVITDANSCSNTSSAQAVTVNALPANAVTASGATTFCAGNAVTFSTAAGNNYQWQLNGSAITGATTNTYAANATGNYSVVITDANSCSNTSSAQAVTVNGLPANAITASGALTFCNGSSVTFTTAAGNIYQWQLNGSDITGATTNTYAANATGNYSVVITDANSCTNTSSAQAVTVNGLPANAITASGSTTFCDGNSVTFTTAAGNTYQWQLNGSDITGATSNTYAANATGNYSVVVTDANSCTNTSSAQAVTVNALPSDAISSSGALTFCDGDSVTLMATSGLTYQWMLNGTNITGATADAYTVYTSGNYSILVSNSSCSATSAATAVTVNALPGTPVITQAGNTLTSTAATTYQWYLNGTAITGATSQSYNATADGNYSVMVSNSSDCEATSALLAVTTTGITAFENTNAVVVYPNPYTEATSIKVTLSGNATVSIEVYSMIGEKVQTITAQDYSAGDHEFAFGAKQQGYAAGIYFVKTTINGKVNITKIVEN